jgi:regulator of sigma E protease
LLAGVAINLVTGLVILTALAAVGMPKLINNQNSGEEQFTVASDTKIVKQQVAVGNILPGSPAQIVGLRGTDVVTSLAFGNDVLKISSVQQLHDATLKFAGQTVTLNLTRSGKAQAKQIKLLGSSEVQASLSTNNPKGYLGVEPNQLTIQRSTWSAPIVALGITDQLTQLTFRGLGHALGGLGSSVAGLVTRNHTARENGQTQASDQVGGPVAIAKALWSSGSLGINFVLMLVAILSLTLALMNVLPIPALDGGRLALILLSRALLHRPLARSAEERAVASGMAVILVLVVLITIVDVNRFF